jgi:hypothetical protein
MSTLRQNTYPKQEIPQHPPHDSISQEEWDRASDEKKKLAIDMVANMNLKDGDKINTYKFWNFLWLRFVDTPGGKQAISLFRNTLEVFTFILQILFAFFAYSFFPEEIRLPWYISLPLSTAVSYIASYLGRWRIPRFMKEHESFEILGLRSFIAAGYTLQIGFFLHFSLIILLYYTLPHIF